MRAVVADGRGSVRVADADIPVGEGEIVTVTSTGICGSDLHLLRTGLATTTLGHEFGGRTTDGRLVAVRPTPSCGACAACAGGRENLCSDAIGRFMGTALPGGLADRVLVAPAQIVPMPRGMDERHVALVEPLAVAVHGVDRGGLESGMRACVVGAGSIGLLTCAVLAHRGVDVEVVARHPHQLASADRIGVRPVRSAGFDVVFDAAGTQAAFDESVSLCRPGGTLVELGIFWDPVAIGLAALFKEITIAPAVFYAHGHDKDDFVDAAAILTATPSIVDAVVTHRFALDDAAAAFAVAADRASGAIKVNLVP